MITPRSLLPAERGNHAGPRTATDLDRGFADALGRAFNGDADFGADAQGHGLVTMNQRDDLGDATPGDWLAVVFAGDTFGFPECYGQAGPACDGTPAPVAVLDVHAAVSGIAVVTGALAVGDPSTGGELAAIVAEWATGKILVVQLDETTTSYTGTVEPYISGLTNPVAVVLAPDGSLALGDWGTGTVYRVVAGN